MRLKKLHSRSDPEFPTTWQIYEAGFPPDQRQTREQQKPRFALPEYRWEAIIEGNEIIGVLETWRFPRFVYVDHIAIKESCRDKGYGQKILKGIIDSGKIVVGESELPADDFAKRRFAFYGRLGLRANPFSYVMPPYSPEQKPVPYIIVSSPRQLTHEEFVDVRKALHLVVYGQKVFIPEGASHTGSSYTADTAPEARRRAR